MFMVQICANQANILGKRVYLKDSRFNTLSIYIFSDKNGLVYRAICPESSSLRHSTCKVRVKVALPGTVHAKIPRTSKRKFVR